MTTPVKLPEEKNDPPKLDTFADALAALEKAIGPPQVIAWAHGWRYEGPNLIEALSLNHARELEAAREEKTQDCIRAYHIQLDALAELYVLPEEAKSEWPCIRVAALMQRLAVCCLARPGQCKDCDAKVFKMMKRAEAIAMVEAFKAVQKWHHRAVKDEHVDDGCVACRWLSERVEEAQQLANRPQEGT